MFGGADGGVGDLGHADEGDEDERGGDGEDGAQAEELAEETAGGGAQGSGAPGDQPVAAVDPAEDAVGGDVLAQGNRRGPVMVRSSGTDLEHQGEGVWATGRKRLNPAAVQGRPLCVVGRDRGATGR